MSSSSRHGGATELLDRAEAALVGDGELAQLVDGVAEELDPDRVGGRRREHVDDAAAHGELAAPLDHVDPVVGRVGQVADDVVEVDLVAGAQPGLAQVAEADRERLHDAADRGDEDAEGAVGVLVGVGEAAQHLQPLGDGVAARAQPLVRERLPGGEADDGRLGQEAASPATVSSASRAVAVTTSSGRRAASAASSGGAGRRRRRRRRRRCRWRRGRRGRGGW